MDPREIIEKHMADLVKNIEVRNTTLWDSLIQLGLFTLNDVEHIKVRIQHFSQNTGLFYHVSFLCQK